MLRKLVAIWIMVWLAATPVLAFTDVLDDFNRADAASLGANWCEADASSVGVSSHTAVVNNPSVASASVWYCSSSFNNNQFSQFTFTLPGGFGQYIANTLRITGTNGGGHSTINGYYCYIGSGGGDYYIGTYTAGVTSDKKTGTISTALSNGDVLKCSITGTTILYTRNGTTIDSYNDLSNTYTSGYPGMELTTNSDAALDDFSAGPLASGGGPVYPGAVAGQTRGCCKWS